MFGRTSQAESSGHSPKHIANDPFPVELVLVEKLERIAKQPPVIDGVIPGTLVGE